MRLKQLLFNPDGSYRDAGILLLRIGFGLMFIGHGYPKLAGGPDTWQVYGETMRNVGIHAAPLFWGFLAGLAELGGGILFGLGLMFRPACLLLAVTMLFATINHLAQGDGFIPVSHPVEVGLVFVAFLLIGPGRWSLDQGLTRKNSTF
ncbi:MAG: DoxX family protein [Cytophagales bacterium]|nr:DoxX family protein [Cytophagales bacterium]